MFDLYRSRYSGDIFNMQLATKNVEAELHRTTDHVLPNEHSARIVRGSEHEDLPSAYARIGWRLEANGERGDVEELLEPFRDLFVAKRYVSPSGCIGASVLEMRDCA